MQDMLVKYFNKPKKSDLQPYDIVINTKGDIGVITQNGRYIRFSYSTRGSGDAYVKSIADYGDALGYFNDRNSRYAIKTIIRIPAGIRGGG